LAIRKLVTNVGLFWVIIYIIKIYTFGTSIAVKMLLQSIGLWHRVIAEC